MGAQVLRVPFSRPIFLFSQLLEECLAKADQEQLEMEWQAQILHKQRHEDLGREACYHELAKVLRDNRAAEAELLDTMKKEEAKKVSACTSEMGVPLH